jgi:hypothetical protein
MYTIEDYLNFYKNNSFEEVHWNVMDNLLASILVYVPAESNSKEMTLYEFFKYIDDNKIETSSAMAPIAYKLLNIIKDFKRYENLKISNFQNIKTDDTQFGALVIKIDDITVISYKGTDGSIIGWIENFRLGYQYPTYTQVLAQEFLVKNVKKTDKKVYVVGHSKGGNLAMSSVMNVSEEVYKKIKNVYNFDGPGFRKEEFKSNLFKRLEKKLINIVPTGSVVGTILNNKDYQVVKSTEKAFYEHYPNSWCIFGEHFISGELSSISKQIHDSTTTAFEKLDKIKVEETFETIFKSLPNDYKKGINFNLNDLKDFYKNIRSVDSEVKKYLDTIIDTMIKACYTKDDNI